MLQAQLILFIFLYALSTVIGHLTQILPFDCIDACLPAVEDGVYSQSQAQNALVAVRLEEELLRGGVQWLHWHVEGLLRIGRNNAAWR